MDEFKNIISNVFQGKISDIKSYQILDLQDESQNQTLINMEQFNASNEQQYTSNSNQHLSKEKSDYFSFLKLTMKERLYISTALLMFSLLTFMLSCMFIPVLILKARKFALLYSMSSLSGCFSILILSKGLPQINWNFTSILPNTLGIKTTFSHIKYQILTPQSTNIISNNNNGQQNNPSNNAKNVSIFSNTSYVFLAYLFFSILTIYSAVGLKSTVLTVLFAILQSLTLIIYVLKLFPGSSYTIGLIQKMLFYTCTKYFK